MILYYALAFLAAIGCAVNFVFTKIYQLEEGNTFEAGAVFNCLVGFFGAVIYFFICGCRVEITWFSLLMASLFTLLLGLYTIIGFKIMSMGDVSVYTIFLMLGGMILPYFYGLIFLNEKITVLTATSLIMMSAAIILQNGRAEKKANSLFYILCIAVFVLNGGTSIVSKVHQIGYGFETVSSNEFIFLRNISRFVMFGLMIPFVKKRKKSIFKMKPMMYVLIIGSALVSSVSGVLQLECAKPGRLPATVQFPVISGGTIIFSAIFGFILFKEKISKKQAFCLALCLASTIIFVI